MHHLHDISGLNSNKIADIKAQLKAANKHNHDLVELVKAQWYKGICHRNYEMNMDPSLAWENIHTLTRGKIAHHKTNLNMSICLKNGELASNARETCQCLGHTLTKCSTITDRLTTLSLTYLSKNQALCLLIIPSVSLKSNAPSTC